MKPAQLFQELFCYFFSLEKATITDLEKYKVHNNLSSIFPSPQHEHSHFANYCQYFIQQTTWVIVEHPCINSFTHQYYSSILLSTYITITHIYSYHFIDGETEVPNEVGWFSTGHAATRWWGSVLTQESGSTTDIILSKYDSQILT